MGMVHKCANKSCGGELLKTNFQTDMWAQGTWTTAMVKKSLKLADTKQKSITLEDPLHVDGTSGVNMFTMCSFNHPLASKTSGAKLKISIN